MLQASDVPKAIGTKRTHFYEVKKQLTNLGYNVEPEKRGRVSWYSDEQVQLMKDLQVHYATTGAYEGFPFPNGHQTNNDGLSHQSEETSNGNGLVHTNSEHIPIESTTHEEIYIDSNPLEDIREKNLNLVDTAAQHIAAETLTTLNYLTADYLKHRDFSITGLTEQVNQSEQVRQQSLTNLMGSPEATAKKMLARVRQRRNQ
ncbi:hypothetical protein VB715_18865 [Crocosphaera sp. UHCC 0190]|uniref:hypothetical protein n=1 Tax=Crocosphaera sp. UHCC 0190 TaxID=3110246 RepID=UPI002B1EE1BC|nr:hypothetical protein [Crocosphaera sp. UHCC 0190]MEA5511837.1 hypothetical protein [Crocosphaera sp. UHCC 0190]